MTTDTSQWLTREQVEAYAYANMNEHPKVVALCTMALAAIRMTEEEEMKKRHPLLTMAPQQDALREAELKRGALMALEATLMLSPKEMDDRVPGLYSKGTMREMADAIVNAALTPPSVEGGR